MLSPFAPLRMTMASDGLLKLQRQMAATKLSAPELARGRAGEGATFASHAEAHGVASHHKEPPPLPS